MAFGSDPGSLPLVRMALLELIDVTKSFLDPEGRQRRVLDVASFSLSAGQQRGLRGESGSGKTTLLNVIAGIVPADHGIVRLEGRSLGDASEAGRDRIRARSIGYVFQTFNLLQGLTVLENVLLGMSISGRRDKAEARRLLARVGLAGSEHFIPRQLSTGQQQRVSVARALAKRPKLLLADEPTGNLDSANAAVIVELIRETAREAGAALLLVSHDSKVLECFNDVVDFHRLNRPPRRPGTDPAAA